MFSDKFDKVAASRVARTLATKPPRAMQSVDLLLNICSIVSIASSASSVGLTTVAIYDVATKRLVDAPIHPAWTSTLREMEQFAGHAFPSDMDEAMRGNQEKGVAFYSVHRPDKSVLFMDPEAARWIRHWSTTAPSGEARAAKRSPRSIVEHARVSGRIDANGGISCMPWIELIAMTVPQGCVCGADAHMMCRGRGCSRKYCSNACQRRDWQSHKCMCGMSVGSFCITSCNLSLPGLARLRDFLPHGHVMRQGTAV